MLDSDGMPWSHFATVLALTGAIGLQEGLGSSSFTIAVVLACIVCSFLTLLVVSYGHVCSSVCVCVWVSVYMIINFTKTCMIYDNFSAY